MELVTSDAHQGLKDAIATVFAGESRQRCHTHFMTNLLSRVPHRTQPWVATMVRTVYQQRSKHSMRAGWACSTNASSRPPNCWPTWARISSPSPWPTGSKSDRTTWKSASPRRYGDAPTWWASSRTGLRSGGSSAQSSPSSTTRGRSTVALCPLLPSMSAISTAWIQQCFCPQGQLDQSARVTLLHHLTGHDHARRRVFQHLRLGCGWQGGSMLSSQSLVWHDAESV